MPRVFIPPAMRTLTSGQAEVVVDGATVRDVIDRLDAIHPGTKAQLVRGDQLRPGLTVAIDSAVSSSGLRQSVGADSEIHFLPAIGGG
jgi:molybdopterin synthase sulfur carrier subunit